MDNLKPYATPRQVEIIEAIQEHGSQREAAAALGLSRGTVSSAIADAKRLAAKRGIAPAHDMNKSVPEGYLVKGVSTNYDEDGNVRQQWVKSQIDPEKQEEFLRSAYAAFADTLPRERAVKKFRTGSDKLLNLYVITDYHLGMKAWREETGADWDMSIAEQLLVDWFRSAIKSSPKAKTAILGQLGDFLHYDGMDAVTPMSGHILDADTRFQKIVRVAIRALRRIVRELLSAHEHVHIIMAEGNHDMASSIWLRELFAALYDDEPRVTVDQSADPYYCYEHGLTSVFFHHGHKRKPSNIDDVFAAKFREIFGRTKFSYAHLGHLHNDRSEETNLMRKVEQHQTLASPDAYASRGGWISGRSAKRITYHTEYGEIGRESISPEMVQ